MYQDITDESDKVAKSIVGIVNKDRIPIPIEVYGTTEVYNNGRFFDF